ncbi:MAG: hypothetical protein ACI9AT_001949 [Ulvibacter sp.]|jgi:hypothetical protein
MKGKVRIYFTYFIFVFVLGGCNDAYNCSYENMKIFKSKRPVLHYTGIEKSGLYLLDYNNGIFLDTLKLGFNDNCDLYQFYKGKKYQLLKSQPTINQTVRLRIKNGEISALKIEQTFQSKKEMFVVFNQEDFFHFQGKVLGLKLFYSNIQGFIGSYLYDNSIDQKFIIAKRGDILSTHFDYSKYSFRVLK